MQQHLNSAKLTQNATIHFPMIQSKPPFLGFVLVQYMISVSQNDNKKTKN